MNEIITFVSIFILFLLGVIVIFNQKVNFKSFSFFSIIILFSLVNIADYLSFNTPSENLTLFYIRSTAFLGYILILSLLVFIDSFSIKKINEKYIKKLIYLTILSLFMELLIFSNLTFKSVTISKNITPQLGFGIYIFVIINILTVIYLLYKFYIGYKKSNSYQKLQIQYIYLSFSLFFIFVIIFNILLPIFFKIDQFSIITQNLYTILIFLIISYSITQRKLFNLAIATRAILIYLLSYIILIITLIVSINILQLKITNDENLFEIIFSLIILIIFPILKKYISILLDRYIFRKISDTNKEVDNLFQSINKYLDIDNFFELLKNSILNIFGTNKIVLIINTSYDYNIYCYNIDKAIIEKNLQIINTPNNIIIIDYIDKKEDSKYRTLINSGIEVIIPIIYENMTIATILLGRKYSNDIYYRNDIDILNKISLQLSLFINNINLYKKTKDFSLNLQDKIATATKELEENNNKLKRANEELKGLDQLKDDLISISSHELRTPASIVKGNVYMAQSTIKSYIKTLPKNKRNNEYIEKLDRYIQRSIESIESEIRIINTLLEASRMGKSNVPILPENLDLVSMIESQVDGFKKEAMSKGIKIIYKKNNIHMVYGDRTKVEEILGNLISNAIKYSERGEVEISTEDGKEFVTVHIKDDGVGIPEEEIPNLFQKFHRLNNYIGNPNDPKDTKHLLVRPGGTGLGLYVVKGLIERMNGKIWLESIVGKGSIFSFKIPVAKDVEQYDNTQFQTQDVFKKLKLK